MASRALSSSAFPTATESPVAVASASCFGLGIAMSIAVTLPSEASG